MRMDDVVYDGSFLLFHVSDRAIGCQATKPSHRADLPLITTMLHKLLFFADLDDNRHRMYIKSHYRFYKLNHTVQVSVLGDLFSTPYSYRTLVAHPANSICPYLSDM